MKEDKDKLLDNVIEKMLKSSPLESPSSDFTNRVMSHVDLRSGATVYKPLISKMGWAVIFGSVVAYVVYLYVISDAKANDWFKAVNFSVISDNRFSHFFSGIQVGQVTFYAMLVCGLMLCAQIPILKYFIEKRQHGCY